MGRAGSVFMLYATQPRGPGLARRYGPAQPVSPRVRARAPDGPLRQSQRLNTRAKTRDYNKNHDNSPLNQLISADLAPIFRVGSARRASGRVRLHALAQPGGLGLCMQCSPTGPRTPARPTLIGLYPTHLKA